MDYTVYKVFSSISENVCYPCILYLLGVCDISLEPEQLAYPERVCAVPHQCGYLRHEGALELCGHVLLGLLLAQRGPLELLHQLPTLVSSSV